MEVVTVPVGGLERRYLLARPDGDGPLPLIVFLHGTGGTADWADEEAGWSALARRECFILALPDALPPDPDRPPKFLTNPPRWNDGSTHPGDVLHTEVDDVGFLAAVLDDVVRQAPVDRRRIYLSGFSNGAGMTFRFASEQADRLTAIAPVAGLCWVEPRPVRPVPTLYLIGSEDPLVPLTGGPIRLPWGGRRADRPPVRQTLEKWAAALGCDPLPTVVREGPVLREELFPPGPVGTEFRAIFIEGLGHHWPGGKGRLSPKIGGRPSNALNANAAIWEFFRRHAG